MTDLHDTHNPEEFEQSLVEHDQWFRHSASEPHHMQAHGETKTYVILLVLFGTVIFVFGTGYLVLRFFESEARYLRGTIEEASTPRQEYLSSMEQWETDLSGYGWASATEGRVHIPLDRAMQQVLKDYRSNASAGQ